MDIKIDNKKQNEGIKYNPALDRYTDILMFPEKVKQAQKNLKGRDILKELDAADEGEITKPAILNSIAPKKI